MKIAVVGAGAAGLFVSGFLAQNSHDVYVFDKNEKVGKKLFITGKGRCNFTNYCSVDEFLPNVVRGRKFVKSALYNFDSFACARFFANLGLKYKIERGNRAFPESDKSSDVIKVLKEKHCKKVKFCLNEEVLKVDFVKNEQYPGFDYFVVKTTLGEYEFDKVIVATGGKSYKSTGSDGFGYQIAKSFGHKIVEPRPALCPILLTDKFVKVLQGVSLKNVALNAVADDQKFREFGEMLFTDKGISGPIVLSLSSQINRAKSVKLSLDFKPALTEKQLDVRLLRDFDANKNKDLVTILKGLLPKAVADVFAQAIGLDENKKVHDITKEERAKILHGLKEFQLAFDGLYDIDTGIVTSGGGSLDEINPKTFESKLQPGLYFIGEVLDIDALTGGFNLQIAWATAYACYKSLWTFVCEF